MFIFLTLYPRQEAGLRPAYRQAGATQKMNIASPAY